jgi:hypothetical protein
VAATRDIAASTQLAVLFKCVPAGLVLFSHAAVRYIHSAASLRFSAPAQDVHGNAWSTYADSTAVHTPTHRQFCATVVTF